MPVKTPRKKDAEQQTEDGFTPMGLTTNMSLPCKACNKHPKKFLWKSIDGESVVYCHGCPRG